MRTSQPENSQDSTKNHFSLISESPSQKPQTIDSLFQLAFNPMALQFSIMITAFSLYSHFSITLTQQKLEKFQQQLREKSEQKVEDYIESDQIVVDSIEPEKSELDHIEPKQIALDPNVQEEIELESIELQQNVAYPIELDKCSGLQSVLNHFELEEKELEPIQLQQNVIDPIEVEQGIEQQKIEVDPIEQQQIGPDNIEFQQIVVDPTEQEEIMLVQSQPEQCVLDDIQPNEAAQNQAFQQIFETSAKNIQEQFLDQVRNTTYFSQQNMIDSLQQKFGSQILSQTTLSTDQRNYVVSNFKNKFVSFLSEENEPSYSQEQEKNKIQSNALIDKNFNILKERLNKVKEITEIQQNKITRVEDEKQSNQIIDEIIKGALTDTEETFNKQLDKLKNIMQQYQSNNRNSGDSTTNGRIFQGASQTQQQLKRRIESNIKYINDNTQNMKNQINAQLKTEMRQNLKSQITQWKQSQEEKKEAIQKLNLQSQNMWFTLLWYDGNDLDLYVKCPCGQIISFRNTICRSCDSYLEIDMNAGIVNNDKNPVEHIYLKQKPKVGSQWEIYCQLYTCRNNKDSPYTIQIEHEDGRIVSYSGVVGNNNQQSPVYKYTVSQGIDRYQKNLTYQIRNIIEGIEEII